MPSHSQDPRITAVLASVSAAFSGPAVELTPEERAAAHIRLAEAHERAIAGHEEWLGKVAANDPKVRVFYRLSAGEVAAAKAAAARQRELAAKVLAGGRGEAA